jgi:hypothetical protein
MSQEPTRAQHVEIAYIHMHLLMLSSVIHSDTKDYVHTTVILIANDY